MISKGSRDIKKEETSPSFSFSVSPASKMNTTPRISDKDKGIAQYSADAGILAEYKQTIVSGKSFDYSRSVLDAPKSKSDGKMMAYSSIIQRGGLVQPFGSMLAIEEPTFRIIGYNDNWASLAKASASREISLLNPIWVCSRTTQKPFYAIMHQIDVGIVIDLESARSSDHALSLAGTVLSDNNTWRGSKW
ncbi:hypothetical protein K1719_030771 [Acacia pycnantha]|nr:hypothetical protein K1719_030771 [Acacia pycnantha]